MSDTSPQVRRVGDIRVPKGDAAVETADGASGAAEGDSSPKVTQKEEAGIGEVPAVEVSASETSTVEALDETERLESVEPNEEESDASACEKEDMKDAAEETSSVGKGKRRLLDIGLAIAGIAAALAVGVGIGAWQSLQTPQEQVEMAQAVVSDGAEGQASRTKESQQDDKDESKDKKDVTAAIDVEGAAELVNGMGLPKTSKVKVDVADRSVIVVENAELVDKLVAERAYDRAFELAGLVGELQADDVTWVLDNGNGATAAVVVEVGDKRATEDGADVGRKLARARGYALNEGAYEPVKTQVVDPAAGVTPVAANGDALVTPAQKAEVDRGTTSARTRSDTTSTSRSNSRTTSDSTSSSSGTVRRQESSGTNTDTSSSGTNRRDNSTSGADGSSGTDTTGRNKRWVSEKGHWEDTYEERQVKVGNRWVVDKEAWTEEVYEDVTVYQCSDGFETTSEEELEDHLEQVNAPVGDGEPEEPADGEPVPAEEVTYTSFVRKDLVETVNHGEEGHYEDVYETQKVVTGTTWVVDEEGHWE